MSWREVVTAACDGVVNNGEKITSHGACMRAGGRGTSRSMPFCLAAVTHVVLMKARCGAAGDDMVCVYVATCRNGANGYGGRCAAPFDIDDVVWWSARCAMFVFLARENVTNYSMVFL
ncbi:hypothetical protein AVEN_158501-1 [Araneus ventricosus]|uniref:Uncharacterized protein n=1 Tax=Araneus ventricosus TaxID=182803 RepID=A0A4Y2QZP6_ARAVE|nr:hypothetical protein AVEN_158501-1 [Araneus ventricosus]